jgi:acyl carrier protein
MKRDHASLAGEIQQYIAANFLPGEPVEHLKMDDLLIESGIIDSGSIMMFVAYLEESYEIQILDEELFVDNFATVHHVVEFLSRKLDRKTPIST